MKPTLLSLSLLLALPLAQAADPAPAAPAERTAAREELAELRAQIAELSRRMADLSVELGDVGPRAYAFRYVTDPDRAVIGVVLAAEERGARIEALTPDSPAERAGMRSGDVITAIDGKPLAGKDARAKLDEARERLASLKDGHEVRIAYERGGKPGKELRIAAQRRTAQGWPLLIADDDGVRHIEINREVRESMAQAREGMAQARVEMRRAQTEAARAGADARRALSDAERARVEAGLAGLARLEALRDIRPGWNLNLTSLNTELGRYFGTDEGVLVLSAGSEAFAGLEAGDVIRKVDGRAVTRPEDALRALRDQPTGSEVSLDVLRQRKALALKVKVPEYKSIFRIGRSAPLPPEPPSPPSAPDAPAPPSPPPAAPPSASGALKAPTAWLASEQVDAVSPREARNEGNVGAPGLWGGVILSGQRAGDSHCLLVDSHRVVPTSGRPLTKIGQNIRFLACRDQPFDDDEYERGRFATFAGHVAVPGTANGTAVATLAVTDAKVWGPGGFPGLHPQVPQGNEHGGPRPVQQGAARMRGAGYQPRP